jgi:hypothetical protein
MESKMQKENLDVWTLQAQVIGKLLILEKYKFIDIDLIADVARETFTQTDKILSEMEQNNND